MTVNTEVAYTHKRSHHRGGKERREMSELKNVSEMKFTIRMLAAHMGKSIEDLASDADIDPSHLKSVSSGRAKMTADDLVKLVHHTGIPMDNIDIS